MKDGRRLGFAECGVSTGEPLLYFHGWPSSRLESRLLERPAAELGLRIIAPDRPGYGLSDLKHGRMIPDWAADVAELADHLGIGRFQVLGISGGGPYAIACAARIPERILRAALVCSVGPVDSPDATRGMVTLNRLLIGLARNAPWLAEKLGAVFLRLIWGTGEQALPRQIERQLPEADKLALASPEVRQMLIESSREALRGGVQAAACDGFLYARPWGFALEEIRLPVELWHGDADVIVPVTMGRDLARRIPACRAKFYPEEGHFSLPFSRTREILEALIGDDL